MAEGKLTFVCEIILAILLPPLGVCLRFGCFSCEVLICLLLTLLGYIPGIVYAIYVITFVGNSEPSQDGQYVSVA